MTSPRLSTSPLEDLIDRLAQHSPHLEDLSPKQLEDLGRLVIITN